MQRWNDHVELMKYSAKPGRKIFEPRRELHHNIPELRKDELPPTFQLKWQDICMRHRIKEEAKFLWSLWA
jgi:hypothetical protein